MSASAPYPIEEVWTPLLLAILAVIGGALLAVWVARRLQDGRRALLGAALSSFAFGVVAGHDAVDPSVVSTKLWMAGVVLGVLAAGCALRRWPLTESGGSLALGFVVGALPLALWTTVEYATATSDPTEASEARAAWRRRFAPWDPDAALAMAWVAQRADQPELASARRELAVRLGADEALTEELHAELLAREGDCDGAREAFDRAMALRAERALDTFDLRLDRAYRLPETFVRRCGLNDTAGPTPAD